MVYEVLSITVLVAEQDVYMLFYQLSVCLNKSFWLGRLGFCFFIRSTL